MAFSNVIPAWLLMDVCRTCGKKLKYTRDEKPGVDCVECGGDLELAEEEDADTRSSG